MRGAIVVFLAMVLIAIFGMVAVTSAVQDAQPATIVITTDGTTAQVDTVGGDVGYPVASLVEIERDDLGIVVVSRVRLVPVFDEQVYLPVVQR